MKTKGPSIITAAFCALVLWAFTCTPTVQAQARLIIDQPVKGLKEDSTKSHHTTHLPKKEAATTPKNHTDTSTVVKDSALIALNDSLMAVNAAKNKEKAKKAFLPDPKRALWLSLVLPGAGQIYNKKYWKLPIIYGGFLGCTYALMWNQQMYRDYSQAYLDIMDDDPNTKSYLDMLPPRYDITGREEQFKNIFKRKKDYYRRYRDLSAFCFVGVYLISVVDAYVDAQLSSFDISPDLSMRIEPAVINTSSLYHAPNAYGVGCSINF